MQSPIPLFVFPLEEACFTLAAFPIRTFHSLFFFFLFYQQGLQRHPIDIFLSIDKPADMIPDIFRLPGHSPAYG